MITLALAGSERGGGKTLLAYHLSHMLAQMGFMVLAVDLDPQPDLTAGFLAADAVEALWGQPDSTVWDGVLKLTEDGSARPVTPVRVRDKLALLPGDPALDGFEDIVPGSGGQVFQRIISGAGQVVGADIAIVDLGPGLGPVNRSALAAADRIALALTADVFSLRGLDSLGPRLRALKRDPALSPSAGSMEQIGYVLTTQQSVPSVAEAAFLRRLGLIPDTYARSVADPPSPADGDHRSFEIGRLRDYRSLEPLARSARKPMFDLSPGDGAIGATASFVQTCRDDFAALAREFLSRLT